MGIKLFDFVGTPATEVRLDVPMSFDHLVAALFYAPGLSPADLQEDAWVRALVTAEIAIVGVTQVWKRGDELPQLEAAGAVEDPAWLALCRRRVSEVFGQDATTLSEVA